MASLRAVARRVRAYEITDNFVLGLTSFAVVTVWAVAIYLGLPE